MSSSELSENATMQDQDSCPHEIFTFGAEPKSALEQLPDGTWRCKFCKKIFSKKEDAASGQYI